MRKFDYIIVGAGLAGGILARNLAEKNNKKVLIIDRRNHISGNIYEFNDAHGVKVQKYGPHVLHTNDDTVYKYITQFCEPVEYRTKCEAVIDGISTPSPFNFKTIDQFYSSEEADKLKQRLLEYYDNRPTVTVVDLLESTDSSIKAFAEFLFEKDYRPYTAKQWNLNPEEIDPSVLKRVPIVLSYGDTYFYDKYEFMPKEGFVSMYEKIVAHPNITIELEVDALEHITFVEDRVKYDNEIINIIYTGAIDELFGYKFGVLPYRSLRFEFKSINVDSFQNVAIVAHPQEKGYTRITEYTKMPEQSCGGWTDIAYEYPVQYDKNADVGNEPYYPVLTDDSQKIYAQYSEYAKQFKNLILCGRLADFKYYNMDQVILRTLQLYESMEVR